MRFRKKRKSGRNISESARRRNSLGGVKNTAKRRRKVSQSKFSFSSNGGEREREIGKGRL